MTSNVIPHSRPTISEDDVEAVARIIRSGMLITGGETERFEEEFAAFVGATGAVAVSSGTAALHLALQALGVGSGDQVLLPSYVCDSVLHAVHYVGAEPQLLDVGWNSNLVVRTALDHVTNQTRAIIVPHMFGHPVDCRPLIGRVPVIEDCALALGATLGGRQVGSVGEVAIFSFYATKLMTTGVGGMITSRSPELLERLRDLRHHADREEYAVRYHYDMSDMEAALGRSQLRRYGQFLKRRRELASLYLSAFKGYGIHLPQVEAGSEPAWYRFVFRAPGRGETIRRNGRARGVVLDRPVFRGLHHCLGLDGFPITEALLSDNVSVPIYPSLTESEVHCVIETTQQALGA